MAQVRLDHDRGVVVVGAGEAGGDGFLFHAGGDHEAAEIIRSAAVDRRVDADRKTFDAAKDQLRGQYLNSMQQGRIQEFVANLKSAAKITDRRKEVEAAMRRTSS